MVTPLMVLSLTRIKIDGTIMKTISKQKIALATALKLVKSKLNMNNRITISLIYLVKEIKAIVCHTTLLGDLILLLIAFWIVLTAIARTIVM